MMKLGIIGLPGSGKTTIFSALTRSVDKDGGGHRQENKIGTIKVPDQRVDRLSAMYNPRKTIYAQVEYFLPKAAPSKNEGNVWSSVRDCDALIHVARNFRVFGLDEPDPGKDINELNQDMVFEDLVVAEKRIERIGLDKKRGKKIDDKEQKALMECHKKLESELPIRSDKELASSPVLRGFAFVSARPQLLLFNNEDDDESVPEIPLDNLYGDSMVIRGKLEQELSQMSDSEAAEFLEEFNIQASAMDRVIKKSYELLGLIVFFTVGEDEVRAWTIKKGTEAVDAAEVIHSDIKKGFIRAEVLSYKDLMEAGSYSEARKKGTVRLEGKTYAVEDGDIINYRFNV